MPIARIVVPALALAFCLGACAAKTVPSLSDEQRRGLGRVGVVVVEGPPKSSVSGPTPLGGFGGGVLGAAEGVGVGVLSGAGCLFTAGYAWPFCISALMTPYWVGRGLVEGALNAVPEGERQAARAAIVAAIAGVETRRIARGIEEEAHRRSWAVTVMSPGPPAPGGPPSYRDAASDGIDTMAEITLLRLALTGRPSSSTADTLKLSVPDVNPALGLLAEARLRLVRTTDDVVLFERTYRRLSPRDMKFVEWARDDAAELRSARDQALDDLARDVTVELAGVERPSAPPSPE
jgi:hypothetical protein